MRAATIIIIFIIFISCKSKTHEQKAREGINGVKSIIQNDEIISETPILKSSDNVISQSTFSDSIYLENTMIIYKIKNESTKKLFVDERISFEYFNNNKWLKFPFKKKFATPDIEIEILENGEKIFKYLFSSFEQPFGKGKYRLLKKINYDNKIIEIKKEFIIH